MHIKRITNGNITIRPTDKKMKQAKQFLKDLGILPKPVKTPHKNGFVG